MTMIIDCHGHYTVLPKAHDEWREKQKAAFKAGTECPAYPDISDDEIRETIESNQLRLLKERGADMTIFSPRASAMKRFFSGPIFCTAARPQRRTADAARPGTSNSRTSPSIATVTLIVSRLRHLW